jgi:methionine sulfoxide reductase heme-binding subunit
VTPFVSGEVVHQPARQGAFDVALEPVAISSTSPGYADAGSGVGVRRTSWVVWWFRLLVLVPFVLVARELLAAIEGDPTAVRNISSSAPDVLGNGAFILFVLMLSVTPVQTITGWRWHLVLRRDFGVGTFAVAALDLVLIAVFGTSTAHGGFIDRVAGHIFLLAGTLAVVALIPLVLTSTLRTRRWLGRRWKPLHRLTYVVWVLILLHLAFLPSLRAVFVEALIVSAPLAVLRVPAVKRWWSSSRRSGTDRALRAVLTAAVAAVFVIGVAPFVVHFANAGSAALAPGSA